MEPSRLLAGFEKAIGCTLQAAGQQEFAAPAANVEPSTFNLQPAP